MDVLPSASLVVMFLLLICSFMASASETSVLSSSKIKLQNMAENGKKKAKIALKLKEEQQKVLASTLIINNIVNISLSAIATLYWTTNYPKIPTAIITIIVTILVLIFGEITPKNLASRYPESFMMFFVNIINFFTIVLRPISILLNGISILILKIFHIDANVKENAFTEEEIKTIVDISHEDGVIETEEKEIIHNLFDFTDLTLKDIMVPRVDMKALDINATYEEVLSLFKNERYTRIPIYEETIDNIVGIINIKDFFLYEEDKKDFSLKQILREASFQYENRKVSDILNEMKKTMNNFVIVLDEYGTTVGIATMEDILEEIVGDIKDEFDEDEDEEIKKIKDNEYIIEGSVKIDDINTKLGTNLQCEDVDSIGGIIISNQTDMPKVGSVVHVDNYILRVLSMDNNRITKVKMTILNETNNIEKKENE